MSGIAEKLKRSLLSSRAMHGYLFTGAGADGEGGVIEQCASILLFGCVELERLHTVPDYIALDGTAKVDRIREIKSELAKRTYSTDNRVVVIRNVHLLNEHSINAMLKMLEEPPEGTYFLLSGIELQVLPTIRSRVMTVRLGERSAEEISAALIRLGAGGAESERLALESAGSLDAAIRLYNDKGFEKLRSTAIGALFSVLGGGKLFDASDALAADAESARAAIFFILSACHDVLLKKSGCHSLKPFNPDFGVETAKAASALGFHELARIASVISAAAQRISPLIKLSRIFDVLMIDIAYTG
ncbi:MAG: hypothetical protein IKI64_10000 [Clostridia bacterium]|nr:hypothetical protein [Clostridia bacterium]